jgi:1-acyl-sn-glycerol-3-phosphate acyltransferase
METPNNAELMGQTTEPILADTSFKLPYWVCEIGQRLTIFFTGPLCRVFLRKKVYGKENIKGIKPGVIFAMNHLSEWDPFAFADTFSLFSRMLPIYFISLESKYYREHKTLRSWFYGGNFFRFMGAYPAILGMKDYEKSLAFQIEMLKKGKNVLIFPEGGRSKDGKLQPAKGGVIALAKAANVSVVPVAISDGVFHVSLKDFLLRKRSVTIHIGKPISNEEIFREHKELQYSDYPKLADEKIMAKIAELLPKSI